MELGSNQPPQTMDYSRCENTWFGSKFLTTWETYPERIPEFDR